MKKKKAGKGILIDIGILLVCLLVVSTCLTSGIFARFISSARGGVNTGRVAVFNVGASSTDANSLILDEGSYTKDFSLTVTSKSETAVRYTITLNFNSDISRVITAATIGNDNIPGVLSDDGTSYTWTNVGTFAPGLGTQSQTLTLTLTISRATLTSDTDIDFAALVTFTQVD